MKNAIMSVAALIIMVAGCTTHTNLTNDSRFKDIVEKQFQTQDEFVVLQYSDSKKIVAHKFGRQGVPSREEIAKNKLPFVYYGDTIQGILPKATHFKVIKVTLMRSFETTQTYYLAEILDGPFKSRQIEVSLLTGGGEVPQFLEKYAVPVGEEAGE